MDDNNPHLSNPPHIQPTTQDDDGSTDCDEAETTATRVNATETAAVAQDEVEWNWGHEDNQMAPKAEKAWLFEQYSEVKMIGTGFHRTIEGRLTCNVRPKYSQTDKTFTLDRTDVVRSHV